MRISVLWSELSGYFNRCLQQLVADHAVELQVFRIHREQADPTAHPYRDDLFAWISELHTLPDGSLQSYPQLQTAVTRFQPDLLLISGWTQPAYLRLASILRQQGVYVICGGVDNQWMGTVRQWSGVLAARWRLHPYFDALWTTGRRATRFAHKLGYQGDRCLQGFYTCDYATFGAIGQWRLAQMNAEAAWPARFLFTGRLTTDKGILDLLQAYRAYRQAVDNPWELWIVGSGPLAAQIEQMPGVQMLGFLQPDEYVALLKQVGGFLLPSHSEPWGVVVHEAVAAALPVICSQQCGSSEELVQNGHSGYLFDAGDVARLTGLLSVATDNPQQWRQLGRQGFAQADRYTPAHWARNLVSHWQTYSKSRAD